MSKTYDVEIVETIRHIFRITTDDLGIANARANEIVVELLDEQTRHQVRSLPGCVGVVHDGYHAGRVRDYAPLIPTDAVPTLRAEPPDKVVNIAPAKERSRLRTWYWTGGRAHLMFPDAFLSRCGVELSSCHMSAPLAYVPLDACPDCLASEKAGVQGPNPGPVWVQFRYNTIAHILDAVGYETRCGKDTAHVEYVLDGPPDETHRCADCVATLPAPGPAR